MKITKSTTMTTITQGYPETMNILSRFGVRIGGEGETMDKTLEQMCLEHAIDIEEVMTELYKTTD